MAVSDDTEKEEKTDEQPKPKSKKKLIIIVAVVLVAVIAGVVVMMMGGKKDAAKEEHLAEAEAVIHYQTARLDTFIVNLSEQSAFAKVTMLLEYDPAILEAAEKTKEGGGHGGGGTEGGGEAPGGLPPMLKDREPMIKDAVIRVLSSKRASEVLASEGKEKLKEELLEAINEAIGLEQSPVVNIYFVEFIIQ